MTNNTIKELDSIYGCVDYEIKIELNNGKVSSICDTPLNPSENSMLILLYNIDGKMKGNIIISDGVSEIREPFDMSPLRFTKLNQAIENILDERNEWKRTFNAFASTKLAPMRCNTLDTKQAYNISMIEFLLDMDIECFYLEDDIRDYEDLGRALVDVEDLDIPDELENHIDYASYAHDWNMSDTIEPVGIMTRFGYLYYSEYGSKF
jgi:hypothetical protein